MLELKCEGAFIYVFIYHANPPIEPPAGLNYFMGAIEGGGLIERSAQLRGGAYSILLFFQTTRKWYCEGGSRS